jgi:hypothetical protein
MIDLKTTFEYRVIPKPFNWDEKWLTSMGRDGWCICAMDDDTLVFVRSIKYEGITTTKEEG